MKNRKKYNRKGTFLDPLNTNRLTQLVSQVINLGKLCRSRLTQINHIIETVRKIKKTQRYDNLGKPNR